MVVYLEDKVVKSSGYGPPKQGEFAIESDENVSWDKCREQFAVKFTEDQPGLYFCHEPDEGHKVASFLAKTEEILDICSLAYPFEYSKFSKTDRNNVIWMHTSFFWMCCKMRRQLLTILLRCGMNYNADTNNYETALFASGRHQPNYAIGTEIAVKRFLFGFTKYVPEGNYTFTPGVIEPGWESIFKNKDSASIKRMLVLPDGEYGYNGIIAQSSLWHI